MDFNTYMVDSTKEQYIHNHPITHIVGIISTIILASLIYFFMFYSTKSEIHCSRNNDNTGTCSFIDDHFLWKDSQILHLNQIKEVKAFVVESPDDDNIEISIISNEKEKPSHKILNAYSINVPEGKFKIADDLNSFLKNPNQNTFDRSFDNGNAPFICSGLLVLWTGWSTLYYFYLILKKL